MNAETVRKPGAARRPTAKPAHADRYQRIRLQHRIKVNRDRWLDTATSSPFAKRRSAWQLRGSVPVYAVAMAMALLIGATSGSLSVQLDHAAKLIKISLLQDDGSQSAKSR